MRAVYYCRVSTEEENQLSALEHQIQEAKSCISQMNWKLAGGYIDEGRSGTSAKNRGGYQRLFRDLSTDKFDVAVIKSQDRLMRNTKEWYLFIDALVRNQKKLYFYLENRFYTPDDSLITGIKAILAEEFSRDLSIKIKNAHKNRQEKGSSVLITSATWGYDKLGKDVVINEKEAEIVRLIFDLCTRGHGSRVISKILWERGIYSRSGGYFPEITIRRIIRNPLFKGTVVMNKRSVDFNTKKTFRNPEPEWKIHENAVPPIVSPEVWQAANKMMDTRVNVKGLKVYGRNKGKHELSGKIYCGICGSVYWRKHRRAYKNSQIIVDWMCSEYIKRGRNKDNTGCDNIHISEVKLRDILSAAAEDILCDKSDIIFRDTMSMLEVIFRSEPTEKSALEKDEVRIIKQKDFLMDKLLEGTITGGDYTRRNADLEKELSGIRKTLGQWKLTPGCTRLNDIKTFLNNDCAQKLQASRLIRHIDKIIIFPDKIELHIDSYETTVSMPTQINT